MGNCRVRRSGLRRRGGKDGCWVKKGPGRSCLLNHISVKGIALTLSSIRALSVHTNLLIDRRSSQTGPSPLSCSYQGSLSLSAWPKGLPLGAPVTFFFVFFLSWESRLCHMDFKTACSSCENVMKREKQWLFCCRSVHRFQPQSRSRGSCWRQKDWKPILGRHLDIFCPSL